MDAQDSGDNYRSHTRERSRSPRRRSRSPRRSRRSYSPRSRSHSRDDYRRSDRRSRSPGAAGGSAYQSSNARPSYRDPQERAAAKEQQMQNVREQSQQDRRVYVGNLSYDVKWHHLKDFMRQAGEVLFADVLLLPNGMSKGCGIVEYASREDAQNAVNTLSNQQLMGRLVYVREDREAEPRFTGTAPARGGFGGGAGGGGPAFGGPGGGGGFGSRPQAAQIYVSNLPYNVGWQDLKDLFRQAAMNGNVIRADVHIAPDGRPKGSGIVAFESPDDVRNAIAQFNGYDWQGRNIEVREDRFPQATFGGRGGGFGGRGGFGGPMGRGGYGMRGGFGGGMGRGGFGGGGYGGGMGGGGGMGPGAVDVPQQAPNPFTDFATSGGDPGPIIYVRNLPWSTSNEDLVELFQTIGKVDKAEIQYEPNGRSKGTGIVAFDGAENAETAISKFTGYQYGGRPLGLSFVKYINQQQDNIGGGAGDATMDSGEYEVKPDLPTQDQIM